MDHDPKPPRLHVSGDGGATYAPALGAGDLSFALQDGQRVCVWCHEPGELLDGRHRECGVRMVVGSEACVRRRCRRLGGPGCGDDPKLSIRDAARAACAAYELMEPG